MKFQTTILSLVSSSSIRVRRSLEAEEDERIGGARRFSQMEAWMEHFNPSFDVRDLYYGCHCLSSSDRPMSSMGRGAPLDEIDSVCLKYKQCLKCASAEFGESCIPEITTYSANVNDEQCTSNPGTCKRKICECDKEFARAIVYEMPAWNEQISFWNRDFDQEASCVPRGVANSQPDAPSAVGGSSAGASDPQCCGTTSSFSVLYNANAQQCCEDGQVRDFGETC